MKENNITLIQNWCRFLILLVESWRIVIISGTVHWFWLKTSFHPLLWTSSGLTGSWKLSAYIGFGSLRSVKSVKTRGNWKPKKCDIHNDLVPSSIKLKSTLKTTRANQILRKAEKDLLQARVKSINFILDQTSKQLEECRSKLATIVSTQKLRECQDFIDKVSETRFNKVKLRQLNKLNLLRIRKEGNITRSNNTNTNNLASRTNNLASCNLNNSQVNTPPGKESLLPRPTLLLR